MTEGQLMRSGYVWHPTARIPVEASAAGEVLDTLIKEQGEVSCQALVAHGRELTSPLHPYFDHDDLHAAHQHRLSQAAYLLRSIHVRLVDRKGHEHIGGRAFLPVSDVMGDTSRPGTYIKVIPAPTPVRPTEARRIAVRPVPAAQSGILAVAVEQAPQIAHPSREVARKSLLGWAEKLDGDPYFAAVVAAIRALP